MPRILVIDDEPRIVSFLCRALGDEGFEVDGCTDGADGLERVERNGYDLVVLDLMMPGVDGVAVLRALSQHASHHEILVLSARSDVAAKVGCLDLGASDYMTKPFAMAELVARIRARLRDSGAPAPVMRHGKVMLDVERRTADVGMGPVRLSDREFTLLHQLVKSRGQVCPRERLLADVWGLAFDPGTNIVDVCVRRIRRKLGDGCIQTVRNAGYRLAPVEAPA